jgi:hypothetical protein
MDPLITNRIDRLLPRTTEKRRGPGDERDPAPRRKRAAAPESSGEKEFELEPESDAPKHTLDDLA